MVGREVRLSRLVGLRVRAVDSGELAGVVESGQVVVDPIGLDRESIGQVRGDDAPGEEIAIASVSTFGVTKALTCPTWPTSSVEGTKPDCWRATLIATAPR